MLCAVFVPAVPVMMFSVMVTVCIRIELQCSGGKSLCRFICGSLNAGIEPDPRIGQRHLCTHPDSSADECIHSGCLKETGQGTVTAAVRVYDLFSRDLSLFNIKKLELFTMSEMLKNLSFFISDCDPHCNTSFLHNSLLDLYRLKFTVTARDQKALSVNKSVCDFLSCTVVDGRDSREESSDPNG